MVSVSASTADRDQAALDGPVVQQLQRPGGDDFPSLFAGTLMTSGQEVAEVATGAHSELAAMAKPYKAAASLAMLLYQSDPLFDIECHRHGR